MLAGGRAPLAAHNIRRQSLVCLALLGYIAPVQIGLFQALFGLRRGGRAVECTALEMRHTGNRIGGSNPSLSAKPY
jgi:hypothetical protein